MLDQPEPIDIKLLQKTRVLEVTFSNGKQFNLPCEYLRVFSPSAEVRGHGTEPQVLVRGKSEVNVVSIEPVGNYAIRLIFDDGHDSGIYSWNTLYDLGIKQQENWQSYLLRCHQS